MLKIYNFFVLIDYYINLLPITKNQKMIELIGTNAGLVWSALNEGGTLSVKAIKKATKIKADKDLYAALGWLAKEGKLAFDEIEGEINVTLI